MEYISRHIEDKVTELSKSYAAILLTGSRQSGKTTMLRQLSKRENIGRKYVTLDDFNERAMAEQLSAFDKDNLIVPIWMI